MGKVDPWYDTGTLVWPLGSVPWSPFFSPVLGGWRTIFGQKSPFQLEQKNQYLLTIQEIWLFFKLNSWGRLIQPQKSHFCTLRRANFISLCPEWAPKGPWMSICKQILSIFPPKHCSTHWIWRFFLWNCISRILLTLRKILRSINDIT